MYDYLTLGGNCPHHPTLQDCYFIFLCVLKLVKINVINVLCKPVF